MCLPSSNDNAASDTYGHVTCIRYLQRELTTGYVRLLRYPFWYPVVPSGTQWYQWYPVVPSGVVLDRALTLRCIRVCARRAVGVRTLDTTVSWWGGWERLCSRPGYMSRDV